LIILRCSAYAVLEEGNVDKSDKNRIIIYNRRLPRIPKTHIFVQT
jgi:hypothetical protein